MSLAAVKVWAPGEILTASDLNTEFNNIYSNGSSLISPVTGTLDLNGNTLILDAGGTTSIDAAVDGRIDFNLKGVELIRFDGSAANLINGFDFIPAITGVPPTIQVPGEADIGMVFEAKDGEEMLSLSAATTALNYIDIASSATNANPIISVQGTEPDTGLEFHNDQAEEILRLEPVAGGINDITISNAATTANPTIACTGDESDIGITLQNQDAEPMLVLDSVATSTNWVTIASAAAANDATIIGGAVGADAGLTLQGKGTGTLKLGDVPLEFPDADGNAGDSIITDGAGTLSVGRAMPRNYLSGLGMTRTDADTITIAVGECRNTGNDTNMVVGTALAKDTTGAWSAGDGGGMIAAGEQASTWYHVFIIEDGSGTVDAGFDTAINAANLLNDSSYTKYRRIGSVLTDATPDILDFTQVGDEFIWAATVDEAATDATNAANLEVITVPADVRVLAHFNVYCRNTASVVLVNVYSPSGDNSEPSLTNGLANLVGYGNVGGDDVPDAQQFRILTDTSAQIGYRADTVDSDTSWEVGTTGWTDSRGRDD